LINVSTRDSFSRESGQVSWVVDNNVQDLSASIKNDQGLSAGDPVMREELQDSLLKPYYHHLPQLTFVFSYAKLNAGSDFFMFEQLL